MRVLIAHTSEALRRDAWEALDRLGWEVIEANDAHDAVRLCQAEQPHVAVVEASLAWPEGGSLIEHFQADGQLCKARLIVFEPDLDFERAFAGLAAGADEYLVGPVSAPEIAVRVQTAGRLQTLQAQLDDQQAELRELIHTDSLTRLYNRRYLLRQIVAQINVARRHGIALSLLLIDLDRFKAINDTHGHAAGDEALRAVAAVLDERLRDTDIAGRWGGDEFLVLLPGTDAEAALTLAHELVDTVRAMPEHPELTLSIGCATWEDDGPTGLVARADRALYEVKRAGRDGAASAPAPVIEVRVASPAEAGADGPPLRVVVVDDVEEIRSLLRLTLEGPAVTIVGEAADGDEVVEVARRLDPDVVVMDWNMPGADGLQGTRNLARECPRSQVVAFTSTDDRRIHRALLDAGACAHFDKAELGALGEYLTQLHADRVARSARSVPPQKWGL
ncbi:MAG: diguanylate cyclase [Solirubrobacterales bacterium]|nr:diguanylate cyclase [Solirubrobacterales bacterium]